MISIRGSSFSYKQKGGGSSGIRGINLEIGDGECVVLLGKSGSGKTTVTRLINGLIPHFFEGETEGEVEVCGKNVGKIHTAETALIVGSVFQNPRTQFFNVDTLGELAFGCENMALPREEILKRVDDAVEVFDLRHLIDRSVTELSGGEKQRVVCASVYAANPRVFVMDEPSSNLDASSVAKLAETIRKLKDLGRTIVISEHRIHYLMDIADRFVVIEGGTIVGEYTPEDLRNLGPAERTAMGLRCLDVRDIAPAVNIPANVPGHIEIVNLACKYGKTEALNIPSAKFAFGETVGVIGENGAGKSTFACCLSGLKKHSGEVLFDGKRMNKSERISKSFIVMQDVGRQLFAETVMNELLLGTAEDDAAKTRAENILRDLGLEQYGDVHPRKLSGGQRQRTTVASAFSAGKEVLFFDEPTSGLDYESMLKMRDLIRKTASDSKIRFIITHDPELIVGCCTSIMHLSQGRICEQYAMDAEGAERVKSYFVSQSLKK